MIDVQVDDILSEMYPSGFLDVSLLEHAAAETLQRFPEQAESSLSILVTDDARLQELNKQFLGIDAPTDVLSFPEDYTDPDTDTPYLGDIAISYPRAEAQAAAGGHPVKDELMLLVVHGVLHLLGYDHLEEQDRQVMWKIQAEVLAGLGSSIILPPDEPSAGE